MKKSLYRFVLCLWAVILITTGAGIGTGTNIAHAQTQAQTGVGSATADNSTVIVSAGTTELRFSEISFFGPNSNWEIHGTLEIFSKKIWIAPTARFSGTGKIIIHNPGDNPYYELMAAGPTEIDHNNGEFIGVTIELRNPHNLVLANINDPGYGIGNPNQTHKSAALNIGSRFIFGVDDGDVILNGNDFGMSAAASLEASAAGTLGSRRMIVTGNSIAGHVIKQFGNTQPVLFPVGIEEGDYTPATIAPLSPVKIHVSVQDYRGGQIAPINREIGMDRIWHVMSDVAVNATYTLQHNRITNGLAYVDENAQIVQYSGSNNWMGGVTEMENAGIQGFATPTVSIHTRANILMATDFLANQTWFTKLVADAKTPPQAVDDETVGNSCEPVHINVLANDKPGSSAILVNSVRIVQQPRNGSVIVNMDGSISYYANKNYVGEDSFRYEIEDEEGQTATATVIVMLNECGIKIPNAFTPNGDGVNDYFVIPGSERFDRMELSIFNRWGNEVYRSNNYDNNWAGLNLHEGVYYYQLRAYEAGRLVYQDGWVLLRRNL